MASEFMAKLIVVSAANLPKTDRVSKIDPYLKVTLGSQRFQTKKFDDNENPTWNEAYFPAVGRNPVGFLAGAITFELYDQDTFSDSHVATATLPLDSFRPDQLRQPLTLTFVPTKEKYSRSSGAGGPALIVRIDALVQSYNSLRTMFCAMPGFTENPAEQGVYIPVQESQGLIYLGVEYEKGGKFDIKVLVTRPHAPVFLDLVVMAGRQYTKVLRRVFESGKQLAPGLVVYEELKLDDVPMELDFNALALIVFDSQALKSTSANEVVAAHGWKGALNFGSAKKVLHNVMIDESNQEIYMGVDEGETMLLVDWDADDADIKLAVLAQPGTATKGFDLRIKKGDYKKMSELYVPPRPKLGGRLQVARIYELDDLPYGTRFDDIEIKRFTLANPRQYGIQALTRIMG